MMIESISSAISTVVDFHRGNFTPTVIVWTIMGLIGFVFTAFNLRDAVEDRDAVTELQGVSDDRKQELLQIAHAGVRQDLIRMSQMLMVVTVGVVIALASPVITDAQRQALHIPYWTPTGIALTVALLYIISAIVVNAVLDRRMRARFYGRNHR